MFFFVQNVQNFLGGKGALASPRLEWLESPVQAGLFLFDPPTLSLRTNARLRPQRGHRRTIACRSRSAQLRDNYMAHRWVTRLGIGARRLGLPILPILQASAHREAALTKTIRAGKDAKPARLFVLPGP